MTHFLFSAMYATLALILLNGPVQAKDIANRATATAQNCALKDTSTITISFNGMGESPEKIMALIDGKVSELTALATAKGATKFDIQNKNYSLNPNQNNGMNSGYNYNASYSFIIEPSAAASALITDSAAKGMMVGLNVNAYRQCN